MPEKRDREPHIAHRERISAADDTDRARASAAVDSGAENRHGDCRRGLRSTRSTVRGGQELVGPWAEIRSTAAIGPLTAGLVYDTVRAVVRSRGYPPPSGYETWSADAIAETAHDFLVGAAGEEDLASGRIARLVATAVDETSFEKLMHTTVLNDLRGTARRSERGAVLEQLRHALKRNADANKTEAGSWFLEPYGDAMGFTGDPSDLVAAAYAVSNVKYARWSSTTRRAPIAESDALQRVLQAILAEAAVPVPESVLLEVVVARFPYVLEPPPIEFDDEESNPSGFASVDEIATAQAIWDQLDNTERAVLAVMDEPARAGAEILGIGKSTVHRTQQSIRGVIATYGDDEVNTAVLALLRQAALAVEARGTSVADSASKEVKET